MDQQRRGENTTQHGSRSGGRAWPWLSLLLLGGVAACDRQAAPVFAVDRVVEQSGLLDPLLRQAGVAATVVPGSTGDALLLAGQARADLILVAAPQEVARLVGEGRVAQSAILMHNEYVLVGRETDPANVRAARDGAQALRTINRSGSSFIVPARGSAARFKLEQVWSLQTDQRASPGFTGAEGDVREAVLAAHAQGSYTLVDRATRLTYLEARGLKPRLLLVGGPEMANPYHLVLLNPLPGEEKRAAAARQLFTALTSEAARRVIAGFGLTRYGERLFEPGEPPPGEPVQYRQLSSPLMPSVAPLRPGAETLPNPHGAGGLPMRSPHGAMGVMPGAGPSPHGELPGGHFPGEPQPGGPHPGGPQPGGPHPGGPHPGGPLPGEAPALPPAPVAPGPAGSAP